MSADFKGMMLANRASFLAAGFCIAAWAPMIPYVKERFGLDEHNLGLLLLCVGMGSFVSMPTSGYFSSRFGCRAPIYLAALVVSLCLVVIPFISNIYLLGLVLFCMGIAAVALDVISNINAALVEQIAERNIMSGLHGLYSVGGFLGATSVTFLLSLGMPLMWTGIFAAVLIVLLTLSCCRHLFTTVYLEKPKSASATEQSSADADSAGTSGAADTEEGSSSGSGAGHLKYYFHPIVLLMGIMCFIMFMTEGSMLDWSGVFLHMERGVALEHTGYGYAAFAIAMTCCRLLGDRVVTRFGRGRVIFCGTILIALGFVLVVSTPFLITALLGFAMIGVGASNVVPQLVSISAKLPEVPTHIAVTIVNAIGFTGVLMGPALIGFLAHAITLPYTYLCQAGAVLCVTLMSYILIVKLKKQQPEVVAGAKKPEEK